MGSRKFFVIFIVSTFTFYSFLKTFPLDISEIKRMYFLGFNVHQFVYAKKMAENISNLSLASKDPRLNDGYIFSYYNGASVFWLSLVFTLVPEQYRKLVYGLVNMLLFLFFIFFILIISKNFKNREIFIFVIIPYAISKNVRWMHGGDIVAHLLPSVFFIYAWKKLKDFLLTQNTKDIAICSIFSAISIFFNLTFAFAVLIAGLLYLPKVKEKLKIIILIHSFVIPFIFLFVYQFLKYVKPLTEEVSEEMIEKIFFGENFTYVFSQTILFIILFNPLILCCIAYIIYKLIKKEISEDIIFSFIQAILFLFSHFIPSILIKALFFYKFEFIAFFITSVHLISELNSKLRKLLFPIGTLSYLLTVFLILSAHPSFANFKYKEYESLVSQIKEVVRSMKIMVESLDIVGVITEEAGIIYEETEAKVFGHMWSSPYCEFFIKGYIGAFVEGGKFIIFDIQEEQEMFKEFIKDKEIKYILCQSEKCFRSSSDMCKVVSEFKIHYILKKEYVLFACE